MFQARHAADVDPKVPGVASPDHGKGAVCRPSLRSRWRRAPRRASCHNLRPEAARHELEFERHAATHEVRRDGV